MKPHNLLLLLKRRVDEVRSYRLQPDGGGWGDLAEQIAYLLRESGKPVIGRLPVCRRGKFIFTDMAIDKPGDQTVLAAKWGLNLPQDYGVFCSRYAEYLFAGRISYQIWDADRVEEQTIALRQGWDIRESAPHRLFPFANPVGVPGYFALRWSPDFSRTDVVYCWDYGDVGETHLLGTDGDRWQPGVSTQGIPNILWLDGGEPSSPDSSLKSITMVLAQKTVNTPTETPAA
jgi:hypothetical protein